MSIFFSTRETIGLSKLVAQDYVVQQSRFQVIEGFGCGNAADDSILAILLLNSWTVIPPVVSITVYYRMSHSRVKYIMSPDVHVYEARVALCFYRHNREMNRFLQSEESEVSRTNYFRILVLASIDIILTLPMGIVTLVLSITQSLSLPGPLVFYFGWAYDHSAGWSEPVTFSYAEVAAQGTSSEVQHYFNEWTSPVLAFVIFGLFGFTYDARALYWRIICTIGGWFGWTPTLRRARTPLGDIEFGERSQDMSSGLECVGASSSRRFADNELLGHSQAMSTRAYRRKNKTSRADTDMQRRVRGRAARTQRWLRMYTAFLTI